MTGSPTTREIEDIYPLSPMQQGILFHSIYSPDSTVYLEQLSCTLAGSLDVNAFERAWQEVIRRNTVLRTSFVWEDLDAPLQIVHRRVDLPFVKQDWRHLDPEAQQRGLAEWLENDLQAGFDLTEAPLIRLALIQTGDAEFRFIWSEHHLLYDGWSMPILLQEVFTLYEAYSQGKDIYLRPARPFRDYIAWLQQQDLAKAEAYWREYLKNFYAPTPVRPLNIQSTGVAQDSSSSSDAVRTEKASLGAEATQRLRKLGQQIGLTPNTWVQGAWALCLSRYNRENEVVFGATVAGRPTTLPGSENMVGLFINTLPVRVLVDPAQTAASWLKNLQNQQAASRQYEFTPLVQIQSWSEVPASQPLFESILVFENYPVEASLKEARSSLQIRAVEHFGQTNYPLTVVIAPGADLEVRFVYNPKLFHPADIRRMLSHFVQILKAILLDPEQPLAQITMLTAGEQEQLQLFARTAWEGESLPRMANSVVDLFNIQCERTPAAPALLQDHRGDKPAEVVTYHELQEKSTQLAAGLIRSGIGPEKLVGISVERSAEMIIAIWAVLKAGGAYVPLDPKYPPERLSYMIKDAGIKILLTQSYLVEGLAQAAGGGLVEHVVCLDTDWEAIAGPSGAAVSLPEIDPDQAAYVIYTSGSTGTPKGVVVPHRALANHAPHLARLMELGPGARMAQLISLNFDAAGEEIYPTLVSGGVLVIPHPALEISGVRLIEFCEQYRISHLHVPVPLWNPVVDEMAAHHLAMPSELRVVLVGGESPAVERLQTWSRLASKPMKFINAYGPTEATITSLAYKITIGEQQDVDLERLTRVPVGKPIPNGRVFLLDEAFNLAPVGIPGEIFIGGAGLARSYLNLPELTAEKFVESGISGQVERYYRTGDLGRYLPDGNIEFLGRVDNQVKLRGYRIELEEIETRIRQYPGVLEVAAILREDQPGDKRLVGYLSAAPDVLGGGHPEYLNGLRAFLKERLPDYMVPAWFVLLEDLPRMPNGKIDRRAIAHLPAPEGAPLGAAYVAPRDATEEIIAGLWTELLGVSAPGINDNFFDLGGHSLKATQLLSRIRQTFEIDLPLRSLFESPTIAAMASIVRSAVSGQAAQVLPVSALPRQSPGGLPLEAPPLSFSQQRLWFLDQLEPGDLSSNIPAAVRISGDLDLKALENSLNALIERHEALRTTFAAKAGRPVQVIAPELKLALPVTQAEELPARNPAAPDNDPLDPAVDDWIRSQVQIPFDLANGPLVRPALLRLGAGEAILVVTIHHIVSDGWSMGILVKEIASLYDAFVAGRRPVLAELPLQYADYAAWQRQYLSGDELERQLSYWKKQLAGLPPVLELPSDRPRPAIKSSHGALATFQLDDDLSQHIQALARQEGNTVYMVLLAAFQTLLYRYSGQEDIAVGSAIANRTRPEFENLIGFFVNTLVLRTDLSGDPSFKELLGRVRETAFAAYAHQDLPFEMLVEALQPQRNLSYTPLFQVGFDLQEVPVKRLDLEGLTIRPLEAHAGSAAFDLLMSINQSPGKLSGSLEYNTDLFDQTTIQRLLIHFDQLLKSIVADPELELSKLQMLTETELRQLLVDWNQTAASFAHERCIHELFEQHAARQPNTIALVYRGMTTGGADSRVEMTYAELNRRANILATYLAACGVGPDVLVGISTERSLEMLVGILGVQKAGGAYLPLDPHYPVDRLAYMLLDSKAGIVLTQMQVTDQLPGLFAGEAAGTLQVVCLDRDWEQIESEAGARRGEQSGGNLNTPVTPENLAYVIYTSGSTGRPKGTLLRHRGLCNLVEWQRISFEISSASRVLQFSPFSFDASVWETFMALANGATLCLAAQDLLANGLELVRLMKEESITTVTLPPSVLAVLPDEAITCEALPALRTVVAAGEACSSEIVNRWAPGRRFFDAYGPTETTVCASAALVAAPAEKDPPIGRPIANTQLYVFDSHLKPTPVGVPGELLIGGEGVARGYLNQPDLTAEKFIMNPFGSYLRRAGAPERARQVLYRTGDLVRYRPDGNLEYLGRIDQQVKVRGYRIELGEIESALRQYTDLRFGHLQDCAVVVREDQPGDKKLAAFLVAPAGFQTGQDSDTQASADLIGALRTSLRQTLPEYMVPSLFVLVGELPLSPSGKIDRRLLASQPLARSGREQIGSEYVAPRTETEQTLCKICADLLGMATDGDQSPVGVYDNFFELGGHSLLATQFISRVRDEFKVELPLRTLFEHPTVAEMSAAIDQSRQSALESGASPAAQAPAIRPVSRDARRMKQTGAGLTPLSKPATSATEQVKKTDE